LGFITPVYNFLFESLAAMVQAHEAQAAAR